MGRFLFYLFCILSLSSIHALECNNDYEFLEHDEEKIEDDEEIDKDILFSQSKSLSEKDIPDSNNAMATLEAGPSAIVAGCVNAITGDFLESHLAVTVPGVLPLTVQCNYCSSEKKWNFKHISNLEAGSSDGQKHLYARYFDDSGSGVTYRAYLGKNKVKGSLLNIPSRVFEKGLTNYGSGRICGKTNWRNSHVAIRDNDNGYTLRLGSGIKRTFVPENLIDRNGIETEMFKEAPVGNFYLKWEDHPNGNYLSYRYDKNKLESVRAFNNVHKELASLSIVRDPHLKKMVNWISYSGNANIVFNDSKEKRVHQIIPSHAVCVSYEYNKKKLLTKKVLPEGRFLEIQYNSSGKEKGRVSHLITPKGMSHSFQYSLDGATDVLDAECNRTKYCYDKKTKRLQSIRRYFQTSHLPAVDNFYWSNNGNLIARTFEGDGKTYFSRVLEYDDFDNVKHDKLFGNLTGNLAKPPKFFSYVPIDPNERYTKNYLYSQDGKNLLLAESDGTKQIHYDYHPNQLLKSRFTTDGKKIIKREFFEYDVNGVMILAIWDDGQTVNKDDLSYVTERHAKFITPRAIHPIGLPQIVEEYYWDRVHNQSCLLKKIVYAHSPQGKVLQEDYYGSDGSFAYCLKWEYDNLGNVTKKIDALNQITVYRYDGNSNKIYEEGPLPGWHKEFAYDLSNNLYEEKEVWPDGTILVTSHVYNKINQRVSTIDPQGHETVFTFDALGRITKTQYPVLFVGPKSTLVPSNETQYDAMGNAIIQKDCNGHITKSAYTIRGQPYRIEHPDGSVEQKEYSLSGLLIKEIARNGLITEYTYDTFDRVISTTISDPQHKALKTKSSTYSTFNLLSETDEEGITTSYEYDGAGRCIAMKKGDHLTHYQYDVLGRLEKTIESVGCFWSAVTCHRFLSHRLVDDTLVANHRQVDDCESGDKSPHSKSHPIKNEVRVTCKVYDLLDQIIEERVEDGSGQLFKKEQYAYDINGNRTSTTIFTEAGTAATITEYTPDGKHLSITDALGNQTRFTYDHRFFYKGQIVLASTKTDPLGYKETLVYDTHGNVCWQGKADAFGHLIQEELSFYDPLKHKILSQNKVYEGHEQKRTIATSWKYNSMGDLESCIEALGTSEQKETVHHYNSFGQKEKTLMPNGISIINEYDSFGRLSSYQSTDNTIHYQYTYDKKDRPILVKDLVHDTATERSYDLHDNLTSETLANSLTLTYTYDQIDRPLSVILPDQSSIRYCYNAHRLIAIERIKNGKIAYTHHYPQYDLADNVIEEMLLGKAGSIQYKYDLLQRPISVHAPHWQESIPQDGFDAVGNLLKREVKDEQGSLTYNYAYDGLNQLILEDGFISHTYQNDSIYNRISKNNQAYEINVLNQLKSQDNYAYHYDKNGNLNEKNTEGCKIHYVYDALDRLIEVHNESEITSYTYDSFHRRLNKKQNDKIIDYIYQNQNELGAVINGKIIQFRVLGLSQGAEIGGSIALELDDKTYAPIHDSQGNIVALVDSSGQLMESYRYTAFGETKVVPIVSVDNPWRFSSKRFDPETDFIYFGKRYYDPEIGRWITPDPAGYADGPNLYAYVHNKPLVYIDPDGRFAFALPICNFALSNCLGNTCIPGAITHGAFDFAMSNVHALEQGAMYIGCEDLDYGAKVCLFDNLRQQQSERMDAFGSFIMDAQGISGDDALYHSVLRGTTTSLEVASLATGAYSLGRGAYNLARGGASLAQTGLSTAELTNFGVNRALAANGGKVLNYRAESVNAKVNLGKKLSQLQNAQRMSKITRVLPDGRIRYHDAEAFSKTPGLTRGRCQVVEFNPHTNTTRAWSQCHDHFGKVNLVHPKQINGQELTCPHYPPLRNEL